MNAAIRAFVIHRDGRCVIALLDKSHICRDKWGTEHGADASELLTIEHVRTDPGGARRDDPLHLVAMCWRGNVDDHWGSSTENRALLNAYLAGCRTAA